MYKLKNQFLPELRSEHTEINDICIDLHLTTFNFLHCAQLSMFLLFTSQLKKRCQNS
ncbi:hypothetical protein LguiB_003589 [Lonicera macranthoides]